MREEGRIQCERLGNVLLRCVVKRPIPGEDLIGDESIGCHDFDKASVDFGDFSSWVVNLRFNHVSWFMKDSFRVGCLSIRFRWKCGCHQVESTVSLDYGGQSGRYGN